MKKGYATEAEKAEVKAMLKELGEDESEAVEADVEAVEELPEEDPKAKAEEDEAVKSIIGTLETKIKSEIGAIEKKMDEQVKKFADKRASARKKTLLEAIETPELKDFLKSVKERQGSVSIDIKEVDFSQKAADDMSIDGNYTGTVALSELDPVVSRDPKREPFIEQLVSVGRINAPIDTWIETTAEDGAPLPVAELALIPQKDYDFAERTAAVKKMGVHSKYSSEMSEDLPNLVSEIRNFLVGDLRRVVDTQILTGDGEGENLTGIIENATAYSAGAFAATIANPNRFDVIETAKNQVVVGLHRPNYVVLHPTDATKMNLSKGTDGHYVMPPFINADGQVISGIRVITNTGITEGNFLIGDFSKSSVKYKKGLTVEVSNTDQDDFVRDRITVRALVRLVHRVRANDYGAFVYGNFDTAIAALDSSS